MKKFFTVIGILAIFLGVVLAHQSSYAADKTKEQPNKPVFVDLDGDGFDDLTSQSTSAPLDQPKAE